MPSTFALQTLSLETAQTIISGALLAGRAAKMHPLAVTVLDIRGALKAFGAEDGTSLYRFDLSRAKAMGALGMGFGSQDTERRYATAPGFVQAVGMLSGGNYVPVRGGVLVRDAQGRLLAAVGISGDVSLNDEIAAIAGIEAAGLVADAGAPKT